MSKITYPNKATGDTFSGAEATEIKTIVNTNDDELIALSGEVDLNTAKVGITTEQSNEITANTSKVGITTQQADDIETNNSKISFTGVDLQDVTDEGGTTTNPITAPNFISSEYGKTEQYVDAAPIGSISTIDWAEGDAFMIDDSNVALTLVFTNLPPSGRVKQISVYVKGDRTIGLPSGIYISNEGVPSSILWNQLVFEVLTSTGDVVNFGTVQINILDNQTV